MNSLAIVFKNRDDKSFTMRFPKMKEGITREEAYALGELIIKSNIFFEDRKELVSVEKCEISTTAYL